MHSGTAAGADKPITPLVFKTLPVIGSASATLMRSGLYDDHPFGRLLADFNAGRQHNANQYETVARNWGASLLGLTPRQDLAI
jgi:hypothetical protein